VVIGNCKHTATSTGSLDPWPMCHYPIFLDALDCSYILCDLPQCCRLSRKDGRSIKNVTSYPILQISALCWLICRHVFKSAHFESRSGYLLFCSALRFLQPLTVNSGSVRCNKPHVLLPNPKLSPYRILILTRRFMTCH
jgi:hypothetical protein